MGFVRMVLTVVLAFFLLLSNLLGRLHLGGGFNTHLFDLYSFFGLHFTFLWSLLFPLLFFLFLFLFMLLLALLLVAFL